MSDEESDIETVVTTNSSSTYDDSFEEEDEAKENYSREDGSDEDDIVQGSLHNDEDDSTTDHSQDSSKSSNSKSQKSETSQKNLDIEDFDKIISSELEDVNRIVSNSSTSSASKDIYSKESSHFEATLTTSSNYDDTSDFHEDEHDNVSYEELSEFDLNLPRTISRTQSEKRHKTNRRLNLSFSNDRVREIERHNQILLNKILKNGPSYEKLNKSNSKTNLKEKDWIQPTSSAAINRKKFQRKIDYENYLLKQKLEAIANRKSGRLYK